MFFRRIERSCGQSEGTSPDPQRCSEARVICHEDFRPQHHPGAALIPDLPPSSGQDFSACLPSPSPLTRTPDTLTLGAAHSVTRMIVGQWKEPPHASPSPSSCALSGEGPQPSGPDTCGVTETVNLFPGLSACLSWDLARSPHPGVIDHPSVRGNPR